MTKDELRLTRVAIAETVAYSCGLNVETANLYGANLRNDNIHVHLSFANTGVEAAEERDRQFVEIMPRNSQLMEQRLVRHMFQDQMIERVPKMYAKVVDQLSSDESRFRCWQHQSCDGTWLMRSDDGPPKYCPHCGEGLTT